MIHSQTKYTPRDVNALATAQELLDRGFYWAAIGKLKEEARDFPPKQVAQCLREAYARMCQRKFEIAAACQYSTDKNKYAEGLRELRLVELYAPRCDFPLESVVHLRSELERLLSEEKK